jgi:hypothetical protein
MVVDHVWWMAEEASRRSLPLSANRRALGLMRCAAIDLIDQCQAVEATTVVKRQE